MLLSFVTCACSVVSRKNGYQHEGPVHQAGGSTWILFDIGCLDARESDMFPEAGYFVNVMQLAKD